MMQRLQTTITIGLLAISSAGWAHGQQSAIQPITSEVKNGGTYNLATGTWTRGATQATLAGPGVIYDNTCTVGYYFGIAEGNVLFDSGRIPSTSSPSNATSLTGWADRYSVTDFEIGYCTFSPIAVDIDISFADCYSACDTAGNLPEPTAVFQLINAPAGTGVGGQSCWIVTINVANSGMEFDLGGDCNGTYDDVSSTDSFGWSWSLTSTSQGQNAGPMMAGDPAGIFAGTGQACGGYGDGTSFVGAGAGPGQGIGIVDQYELGNGATPPGCYWFGGYGGANPFAAFYMKIRGEASTDAAPNTGSSYCPGVTCPCGNAGSGVGGCKNSGSYGARLMATGDASTGAGQDSLQFHVYNVNGAQPGLLIRGNDQLNSGLGVVAGDGLLCTSGRVMRSQIVTSTATGVAHFEDWNGAPFGSVASPGSPTNFQYWNLDPVGSPCGSGFNLSNAWTVTY